MAIGQSRPVPIPLGEGVPTLTECGAATIAYVEQSETNWCWAACGEMVMQSRGIPETQCSLATKQFGLQCCTSPGAQAGASARAPAACNHGCWPDMMVVPFSAANTHRIETPISQDSVSAELAAGRPVQVCYRWLGTADTHVALIVGEYPDGDFEVLDPWHAFGRGRRTFVQIQYAYGLGVWSKTFTFT